MIASFFVGLVIFGLFSLLVNSYLKWQPVEPGTVFEFEGANWVVDYYYYNLAKYKIQYAGRDQKRAGETCFLDAATLHPLIDGAKKEKFNIYKYLKHL